ncbi:hypothetical protein ACQ4PT_043868 [Festuca glaucescens]
MASGGGGTFAVQLASLAGHHHVTATYAVRNLDLVRGLGADEALDYNTPEGAALRGLSGRKHDVVMHCTEGVICDFREDWVNLVNYARKVRIFMTGKYTISQDEIVPFLSPR